MVQTKTNKFSNSNGLFHTVAEVLSSDIANLDSIVLCNLLLYGSYKLTVVEHIIIIEATIHYITKTNRLA